MSIITTCARPICRGNQILWRTECRLPSNFNRLTSSIRIFSQMSVRPTGPIPTLPKTILCCFQRNAFTKHTNKLQKRWEVFLRCLSNLLSNLLCISCLIHVHTGMPPKKDTKKSSTSIYPKLVAVNRFSLQTQPRYLGRLSRYRVLLRLPLPLLCLVSPGVCGRGSVWGRGRARFRLRAG